MTKDFLSLTPSEIDTLSKQLVKFNPLMLNDVYEVLKDNHISSPYMAAEQWYGAIVDHATDPKSEELSIDAVRENIQSTVDYWNASK